MKRKFSRLHVAVLAAAGLWAAVATAGASAWHALRRESGAERQRLARLRQERAEAVRLLAGDEAGRIGNREFEQRRGAVRDQLTRLLAAPGPDAGAVTSLDACLAFSSMAESLRERAATAGVEIGSDEWFGFGSHRNEGPAGPVLAQVERQRAAVEQLVMALIEARPRTLLAVQRERPGGDGPGEARDFFRPDPKLTLRRPGRIESLALHIEFAGGTAALRRFLEVLRREPGGFVVRGVEVGPGTEAAARRPDRAEAIAGRTEPLVQLVDRRFAVVVEQLQAPQAPRS